MARLQDLPTELLLMILEAVQDAKRLYPFLFSRQFHKLVLQILYRDLRLAVWDPTLPAAAAAVARGRLNTDLVFERNFLSVSSLISIVGHDRRLLQNTRSVSMQIAEDNPGSLKALCRPPLASSDFIRPLDASAWDMSLAIVLQQGKSLPYLQTITIDWIGTMPNVLKTGFFMRTSRISNTLSIRGVRDSSNRFYSFVPYWFWVTEHIRQIRFESVHFVPERPEGAARPTPHTARPRMLQQVANFEFVDCKATQPSVFGFGSIGKARIIFDRDMYLAEIINVITITQRLQYLEVRARLTPMVQKIPDLALKSYRKIGSIGKRTLAHLAVPFWLTPCGPSNRVRPLQVLTRLDFSLCITDVANLPSFRLALAEKLVTIERLNIMPSLRTIKLVPSSWMREMPFFGHRKEFANLLQMITKEWADRNATDSFGWKRVAVDKDSLQEDGEHVYRWSSGLTLDATEIAKYVENVEQEQEDIMLT